MKRAVRLGFDVMKQKNVFTNNNWRCYNQKCALNLKLAEIAHSVCVCVGYNDFTSQQYVCFFPVSENRVYCKIATLTGM